jgi:hypothetical protein
MQLSADPSDFLSCCPWPSAEARGVDDLLKMIALHSD